MRYGIAAIGTFAFILFLILLNSPNSSPEAVDKMFEGLDKNVFVDANFTNDANLSKFIKYTGQGIVKEFQGGYYLAAFVNPFLPAWLIENGELLVVIAIFALAAPVIAVFAKFGLLIVFALLMLVWEWVKKRRAG